MYDQHDSGLSFWIQAVAGVLGPADLPQHRLELIFLQTPGSICCAQAHHAAVVANRHKHSVCCRTWCSVCLPAVTAPTQPLQTVVTFQAEASTIRTPLHAISASKESHCMLLFPSKGE